MTKALEDEIKELEAETTEETTEETGEEVTEVVEETEEEAEATEEEATEEVVEEPTEEEAEKLKKQEAYRERRKAKKDEEDRQADLTTQAEAAVVAPPTETDDLTAIKEELLIARQERAGRQFEENIKTAEKELTQLETPFKEAFTDYDEVVKDALELTRLRMVKQGYTDGEAADYLRREKVLLADRAAAEGKDPVEAVYKEAKDILGVFDEYAESKGYIMTKGKPKTNLQAMREINKPNAMSGGAGRGATATKTGFDDMDDLDEIGEVTIGQMLRKEV